MTNNYDAQEDFHREIRWIGEFGKNSIALSMMVKKNSTVRSGELVNCWKYKTRYDNASAHHLTISKRTPPRVINAKNACMIKMA